MTTDTISKPYRYLRYVMQHGRQIEFGCLHREGVDWTEAEFADAAIRDDQRNIDMGTGWRISYEVIESDTPLHTIHPLT